MTIVSANNPDLNPIENVWVKLKKLAHDKKKTPVKSITKSRENITQY